MKKHCMPLTFSSVMYRTGKRSKGKMLPVKKLVPALVLAAGLLPALFAARAVAHPPFISTSPDGQKSYVCGRESSSAEGCFTHWCTKYDYLKGLRKLSGEQEALLGDLHVEYSPWSPCYVSWGQGDGGLVHAGGVAWWGWKKGKLGSLTLDGFWVRDYRSDKGRDECGFNCTEYGFAGRINDNPDCYHVRENWRTAGKDAPPRSASEDGMLDNAYCMRPMVAD